MHDLSVDGFSERCVFARGRGINLNIDCHRGGKPGHACAAAVPLVAPPVQAAGAPVVASDLAPLVPASHPDPYNVSPMPAGPHSHLFSNLDHGFGARPFQSGGDSGRGAHSGELARCLAQAVRSNGPARLHLHRPACNTPPLDSPM